MADDFIQAERRRELGEFADCRTHAELFVAVYTLLGVDCARQLAEQGGLYRETLREVAADVRAVGIVELATMLSAVARLTPKKPRKRSIAERYATWDRTTPWPVD